jgi:alanine racemase
MAAANQPLTQAELQVDLAAVQRNYAILERAVAAGVQVGACVKADGYGLGAAPIGKALYASGCRLFFVATPTEGANLRAALPTDDSAPQIVVLHGFQSAETDLILGAQLTPVLNSAAQLHRFAELHQTHPHIPAYLHIDTGMNRLGMAGDELDGLLAENSFRQLPIAVVMSHLACADIPAHPMNEAQRQAFATIPLWRADQQKSLANSAGIFLRDGYHFDQVRPGMALYGLNPTPDQQSPMQPVVTLTASILQTRAITGNSQTVGYNATPIPPTVSQIAVLGIGYADGMRWNPQDQAIVTIDGYPCPTLGRVSMDLMVVDASAVPPAVLNAAQTATVLGALYGVDDLARDTGTIGYTVLTGLGARLKRRYGDATIQP